MEGCVLLAAPPRPYLDIGLPDAVLRDCAGGMDSALVWYVLYGRSKNKKKT